MTKEESSKKMSESLLYTKDNNNNNNENKNDKDNDSNEENKASYGPWLGGPGTRLPFVVESFLSWTVALSMLSVSGYQYLKTIYVYPVWNLVKKTLLLTRSGTSTAEQQQESLPCWLELTTSSRLERDKDIDRYQQLIDYLQETTSKMAGWSNEELVTTIRHSDIARRLISLALRPGGTTLSVKRQQQQQQQQQSDDCKRQLFQLWPQLLALPPPDSPTNFPFDLSVILPAYRERGTDVRFKLTRAFHSCHDPTRVEIIVVDAGDCELLNESLETKDMMQLPWGAIKIVKFESGGGRGPCMNYGATQATGRIYTFLHADTTMPPQWDCKIVQALDFDASTPSKNGVRPNSCAFSFGIDTTPQGLNGGPFPPGIKAVETAANWRTQLYSLPYGDQTLSVPAIVFNYLGGFPDQCLMEDYELISLLRRRVALLSKFGTNLQQEKLVIIGGGIPAYCSPRRWQKFGVLYVTFMNSKLVNWYAGGITPDGLFSHYYSRPPPTRSYPDMAPWEVKLERLVVDEI